MSERGTYVGDNEQGGAREGPDTKGGKVGLRTENREKGRPVPDG